MGAAMMRHVIGRATNEEKINNVISRMRHVYRLSHTNCVKNESTEAVQLMFTKNKWQDGDREWKCMRKFQCNCQHFTNVFKHQQPQQPQQQQHNSFFKRYANGRTSVIRD